MNSNKAYVTKTWMMQNKLELWNRSPACSNKKYSSNNSYYQVAHFSMYIIFNYFCTVYVQCLNTRCFIDDELVWKIVFIKMHVCEPINKFWINLGQIDSNKNESKLVIPNVFIKIVHDANCNVAVHRKK